MELHVTNAPPRVPPRQIAIYINAVEYHYSCDSEMSYESVVHVAFPNGPPPSDQVQYSVQYTGGPGNRPSRSMRPGETVKLKDRMCFDVTATNRS